MAKSGWNDATALPPGIPLDWKALRPAITLAQLVSGYAYPNVVLHHALPELDGLSIGRGTPAAQA